MTRRAAGLLAAAILAAIGCPAAAETGQQAFARKDYAAAADLWRGEAAGGSSEASFGLALLNDLGLGLPRDPAKALRWYLESAEAGFAEAQFNVAVMLDAGAGVPRDAAAAAVWYGRAAANEHPRARYNLGLLYASGDGLPQNADLANYWLGLSAAALPAADEQRAQLTPVRGDQRVLAPPSLLAGALVAAGEASRAEMVWTAPPAPPGATFLVEVVRLPSQGESSGETLVSAATDASSAVVLLPQSGNYAWRVSRVDAAAARYAGGDWRSLSGAVAAMPEGRVTLRINRGDRRAERFARELGASFFAGGLWAQIEEADEPASATSVRYAFREDEALARGVAEVLPVLTAQDAAFSAGLGAAPGEVIVTLVGGPEYADIEENRL